MKICHVITRLIIGGAQENTVLTCRGLAEKGHEVVLLSGPEKGPEGSLWDTASGLGFELKEVPDLRRLINPLRDISAFVSLGRIFRSLAPDVVHTHSSKAGILGRWAAYSARVPTVVHTIHGMSFNRTQGEVVQALYRGLEGHCAAWTDRIVSVADAMTRQSVDAGIASPDKFVTIRSGMVTEAFKPEDAVRRRVRESWGFAEDETVVGTIARLFDNKGYDEIIRAMPMALDRFPRLRFVWVGDGKRTDEYRSQLRRMGLSSRVVMTGLIPPERIPEVVSGMDILVHASRWEGLPRAVVQALLMGVPAISFDNDGAPEVVINGETGILVPYGDAECLASALIRLADDAPLRRRLGAEGRRRCLGMFSWRKMVDEIEQLYLELERSHY